MSLLERSELQARARLLLSSAGLGSASVVVECDERLGWVTFGGGRPTSFAMEGSPVEGALDAIEAELGSNRLPPPSSGAPSGGVPLPQPPPSPPPVATPVAPGPTAEAPPSDLVTPPTPPTPQPTRRAASNRIDGGVSLAVVSEFWSGAVAVGPRLDVGVGLGKRWAVVVAEGARFATTGGSGSGLVFDLQSGIAYGAPYATRTGLGAVALVGAERLASGGRGGLWMWSFTGSLGVRASLASGPVDVWLGADVMARSGTIDSPDNRVPNVTGLVSLGCLVPAFAAADLFRTAEGAPGSARQRRE